MVRSEWGSRLLVCYRNYGRADHAWPRLSPRRGWGIVLTRPEALKPEDIDTLEEIVASSPGDRHN